MRASGSGARGRCGVRARGCRARRRRTLTSSGMSSGLSNTASSGYTFAISILDPSERIMSSSNLPVFSDFSKMPRTGGHVPTVTVPPASASALQIAQP